jgi:ankyrin repeat protein
MRVLNTCAMGLLGLGIWLGAALPAVSQEVAQAAKRGERGALRSLVDGGADVRIAEPDGTTALHWLVRAADIESARLLVEAGADVNATNRYGVRPLSLAALSGYAPMVDLLVTAGAGVDTATADGETALMTAARTGSGTAVRVLLAAGAEVDAREHWLAETALMWAAAENHAEVVGVLLEAGARVDDQSWITDTPILGFSKSGGPNQPFPRGGWTPVMYAARNGAIDALRTLAAGGADLDIQDPQGATALSLAIINLHYDAAAALVDAGADPNLVDEAGMGPLYAVTLMNTLQWIQGRPAPALHGELDAAALLQKLLDYGADPNARLTKPVLKRHHDFQSDRTLGEGAVALMRAARMGDAGLARILLARGADPAAIQVDGTTPLMIAAGVGLGAVRGDDPHLVYPSEEGAVAMIDLLLDRGVDVDAQNQLGLSAVHGAVRRSQGLGNGTGEAIILKLAERGATLNLRDEKGETPLDMARAGQGAILNRTVDSTPAAELLARLLGVDAGEPTPLAEEAPVPAP